MAWEKLGQIWRPDGRQPWALHSFMTPVPVQIGEGRIRLYGGMRDEKGVSRIGWIDVREDDPTRVIGVSAKPALDLGEAGMFDDNGIILGDVIRLPDDRLRMYYVGFQIPAKAKFMAYTGAAESHDEGDTFERVQPTPILDRAPQALFINALHSIIPHMDGYRAWISCGRGWQHLGGKQFPQYDSWMIESPDGLNFNMSTARRIVTPAPNEYRIGRPRGNRAGSGYELRVTSDTIDKQYESFLYFSEDGDRWTRTNTTELPRGAVGEWDSEMTCYPALYEANGHRYLFYNGNNMGETGVGVARWTPS